MRRRVATSVLPACAVALVATGCAGSDETPTGTGGKTAAAAESTEAGAGELTARLVEPGGAEVGTATLSDTDEGLQIVVRTTGLPPGFHGFHLHSVGICEPHSASPTDPSMTGDFQSAGGHIGAGESDHGHHPGDLPLLFVTESGAGSLTAVTDALTLADLTDDDGTAIVVHAEADNYANIPERYAPGGPDQMTRNTGDAGGRIACGPIEG
jgi:superoxide dismutase, Cu-Zn family